MKNIIGPHYHVSIPGFLALFLGAVYAKPSLVSFLPLAAQSYVIGIAGIFAFISGAYAVSNIPSKQAVGAIIPTTLETTDLPPQQGQQTNGSNVSSTIGICVFAFALMLLSGCALFQSPQGQSLVNQAESIAENVLLGAAADEADANFKGNYLDYMAQVLRQNEGTIVTPQNIQAILQAAAPDNGTAWEELISETTQIFSAAESKNGNKNTSKILESIATGFNNAAAAATASPSPSPAG